MNEPLATLVDTHCHLTVDVFDRDRKQVIHRALTSGVQKILVPGLDLASSKAAIQLAECNPAIYAAVGIHPHNAKNWKPSYKEQIISLAHSSKVVAIGEIGLDYYRKLSPPGIQLEVFQSQLEIAADLNLPVIIHNRDATSDIIGTLAIWSKDFKHSDVKGIGVLHAYSSDIETALQIIDTGFYVGIAGPITYKNAQSLREIVTKIPLSSVLIETDAPYLTPHPYRGKRNEPANVVLVAEYLSGILGQEYETTARITSENAADLFGWRNGTNHSSLH